jgi:hypothetical protein
MRPFLYSLLIVSCFSLLLWAEPVNTTAAKGAEGGEAGGNTLVMPKQCRPGKTSPEAMGWRWRQGALVRVYYLKGDFGLREAEAFSRAVANWNDALKEINSQIVFLDSGESESVVHNGSSITVVRGITSRKERVGEIKLHSRSQGAVHLLLTISPAVTDLGALESLMTHELGHTLGLADCYECQRGTTAMAAFRGKNKGNDVFEPSVCDKYAVAAGYAGPVVEQARAVLSEQN